MKKYSYPEKMKKWRRENREWIKRYSREYYERHREENMAKTRAWQKRNRDEFALHQKVNSANHHYPGHLTVAMVRAIIVRDGRKCHWCGKNNLAGRDFTLEHMRPVNDPQWITVACHSCNSARKANPRAKMSEEEHRERVKFFSRRYYHSLSGEKLEERRRKSSERHKRWYQGLTPEKREKHLARIREWRKTHPRKRH